MTGTPQETAVAWAQVCDMRRELDGLRVMQIPAARLTRRERKALIQAIGYLDQATECVRRAQGSLAERSKAAGVERPAYEEYRRGTGLEARKT